MDTKDIIGLTIGLLSAFVALYAAIIARNAVHNQRHIDKWNLNFDLIARASGMVIDTPDLLRLHGIDLNDLAEEGVSIQELIYINLQLDAASALYIVGGNEHVELTQYRKNFLNNPKVRIMWKKHLDGKLFSPSPFTQAVNNYIEEVESS